MGPILGALQVKPDALSRQLSPAMEGSGEETILPSSCVVGAERWQVEQEVQEGLQAHPTPEGYPEGHLFVPPDVRSAVLQWGHSSKVACHPGFHRTLALIQQWFWWPSMVADTRGYVAACSICACGKASHRAPAGLLHPLPIPSRTWSHIAVDFVTGLPSFEGNTTILTIVDCFSKAIRFVPLSKLRSALETANLLISCFSPTLNPPGHCFGPGPPVCFAGVKGFLSGFGASVSLSSGYHPQNSQTERANQDLESSLRCVAAHLGVQVYDLGSPVDQRLL